MTSSTGAYLELAQSYNDGLSNSALYDINFYTKYITQDIHIGNTLNTYPKLSINSNGIGISNVNPVVSLDMGSIDALKIPVGTTTQRPSILKEGLLRYNTTTTKYECYNNNNWNNIAVFNSNDTLELNNLDITGIMNISSNLYVGSRIGIGLTNPQYSLDVNGIMNISSNLFVSTKVGIGTTNPLYSLDIRGLTNFNSNLYIGSNSNVKIGVNTINPLYQLDVLGTGCLNNNLYMSSNISVANDVYICDKSINNFIVPTYGNISIVKNISPFSSSSINECIYNGGVITNYIKLENSQFNFNWWTTGITIESWIYIKSYGISYADNRSIFIGLNDSTTTNTANCWSFGPNINGKLSFFYWNGSAQFVVGTTTLNLNTWYNISMSCTTGGLIKIFLNGIIENSAQVSGTPQMTISTIMLQRYNNYYSDLYFTNLRITKSCLYTTNFTVSTIPLTYVTNTLLLLTTEKKTPLYNLDINGSLNTTSIYNLANYNKDDYEFPPSAMTSASTMLSDGLYIITSSGNYNSGTYNEYKAFNKINATNSISDDAWVCIGGSYPSYIGTRSTTNNIDGSSSYVGEWIQVQMPNPIILTKYKLIPRNNVAFQAPAKFILLGSTNGINWVTLDNQENQYWYSNRAKTTNIELKKFKIYYTKNITTLYCYFRLCINKMCDNSSATSGNCPTGVVGNTDMGIGELTFYGKKVNDNTLNTNSILTNIYTQDLNVGIGTTNPLGRLHIYNSNSVEDTLILTNGNTNVEFYKSQIKFGHWDNSDVGNGNWGHFISTRHNSAAAATNCIDFYCCTTQRLNTIKGGSKLVMTLEGTGNVGIGITNPTYQLDLNTTGDARKLTSSSWTTGSDKRIKQNIITADYNKCYQTMSNLDLKYFKWCDFIPEFSNLRDKHILGWIADEVELYIPKAITIEKEVHGLSNFKSLNTDQIYANMYGSIKYLIKKKEILEIQQKNILDRIANFNSL
jgi:hypothetical protein